MTQPASRRIKVKQIYENSHKMRTCHLDPSIRCLAELHTSRLNRCEQCSNFCTDTAATLGISAQKLDALNDWRHSDQFDERERAALAWCERFDTQRRRADKLTMLKSFSPLELAELTLTVEMMSALNRVTNSLGSANDD